MVEGGHRKCSGCPLQSWKGKDRLDDLQPSSLPEGKIAICIYY
jgi:hypothetical protein